MSLPSVWLSNGDTQGIYDDVFHAVVDKTKQSVVGHGIDAVTSMEPVTTSCALKKVTAQVEDAVAKGAKIALGEGNVFQSATYSEGSGDGRGVGGYFMAPTMLIDMNHDPQSRRGIRSSLWHF
ncbi:Ff.00g011180.m01.CDS01 [Fusarium sp. VM40]|nr:Ff.00g011180.m01.CDS01 [Fusarium sp. VM40]